jgi:hypothetical protein
MSRMSSRWLALLIATGLTLTGAGCGSSSSGTNGTGGTTGPTGGGGTTSGQGWTVLVYMVAANNLEGDAMKDLIEMSSVGSGSDLRIVVQLDRITGNFDGPVLNLPDFTSTKRLLVQNGSLQELQDLGRLDMTQPATLADFIKWGVQTYPGQHYFLDFWDHGGGWRGFGWDDNTITASSPNAQNLTLAKLDTGIQSGLASAGLAKFDIIGFDACLMATVEVANTLKGYSSYLLASEEVEPGHGWDYAAFAGGGSLDALALGRKVIDGFKAQATAQSTVANVTLSLIDNSKVAAVVTALGGIRTGYTGAATVTNQIATGRSKALVFGDNPDPAQSYNLVDLGDLLAKSGTVVGGDAVQAAVTAAVVYHVEGAAKTSAKGISVFFPPSRAVYDQNATSYGAVPGMDDWRAFLSAYYGSTTSGAASGAPTFASTGHTLTKTTTSVTFTGVLASGASSLVVRSLLYYGLPGNGTEAYLFGDQPATVAASGATVSADWDWSILALVQGSGASAYHEYAYLSLDQRSSTLGGATIPLVYEPAGGSATFAIRDIVFQLSDGAIVSDSLYASSGGGMAALTPGAGSKLRALVGHLADHSTPAGLQWIPYSSGAGTGFDATQPVSVAFASVSSGNLAFLGLRVMNGADQGDWLYTPNGVARP